MFGEDYCKYAHAIQKWELIGSGPNLDLVVHIDPITAEPYWYLFHKDHWYSFHKDQQAKQINAVEQNAVREQSRTFEKDTSSLVHDDEKEANEYGCKEHKNLNAVKLSFRKGFCILCIVVLQAIPVMVFILPLFQKFALNEQN